MPRYRVTAKLVKEYEVYVDAENKQKAWDIGRQQLQDGDGDLVDGYYLPVTVREVRHYVAKQEVTRKYVCHFDAFTREEAERIARNHLSNSQLLGQWDDQQFGEIKVEED